MPREHDDPMPPVAGSSAVRPINDAEPRRHFAIWCLCGLGVVLGGIAVIEMVLEMLGGPSGFGGDGAPTPANFDGEQLTYHAGLGSLGVLAGTVVVAILIRKRNRVAIAAVSIGLVAQCALVVVAFLAAAASVPS